LLYKYFNVEKTQKFKSHTKESILTLLVELEPQECETYKFVSFGSRPFGNSTRAAVGVLYSGKLKEIFLIRETAQKGYRTGII
jgi:hypothetical protein